MATLDQKLLIKLTFIGGVMHERGRGGLYDNFIKECPIENMVYEERVFSKQVYNKEDREMVIGIVYDFPNERWEVRKD